MGNIFRTGTSSEIQVNSPRMWGGFENSPALLKIGLTIRKYFMLGKAFLSGLGRVAGLTIVYFSHDFLIFLERTI